MFNLLSIFYTGHTNWFSRVTSQTLKHKHRKEINENNDDDDDQNTKCFIEHLLSASYYLSILHLLTHLIFIITLQGGTIPTDAKV